MKLTDPRLLPAAVFAIVVATGGLVALLRPEDRGPDRNSDHSGDHGGDRRRGPAGREEPRKSAAPPSPPSPEEAAILAPLGEGGDLEGYKVREIHGVRDGVMRVVVAKEKAVVRLQIALTSDEGPRAPATAGRYAVFYSAGGVPPQDGERLAKALAKVLEGNGDKPVPAGLSAFKPRDHQGTPL